MGPRTQGQAVHPPVLPSGVPAPCRLSWWDPLCCLCHLHLHRNGRTPRFCKRPGLGFCSVQHSGCGCARSPCPAGPRCEMEPLAGAGPEDPELRCGRSRGAGSRSGCGTGLGAVALHWRRAKLASGSPSLPFQSSYLQPSQCCDSPGSPGCSPQCPHLQGKWLTPSCSQRRSPGAPARLRPWAPLWLREPLDTGVPLLDSALCAAGPPCLAPGHTQTRATCAEPNLVGPGGVRAWLPSPGSEGLSQGPPCGDHRAQWSAACPVRGRTVWQKGLPLPRQGGWRPGEWGGSAPGSSPAAP